MRGERWIIDGNYRGTVAQRIENCELAFFFDMPVSVCLKGVRTRNRKRDDIACELEPNAELRRDIRRYPFIARPKLLKLFKAQTEVKVITFKTHREADEYLDNLRREYNGFNL